MGKLKELELIDHVKLMIGLMDVDLKQFLLKNRYTHYQEFGNLYNKIMEDGVCDLEAFCKQEKVDQLLNKYYDKSQLSELQLPYFDWTVMKGVEWGPWDTFDIKQKVMTEFGSHAVGFITASYTIKICLCKMVYDSFMNKLKNFPDGSMSAFKQLTKENYNAVYIFLYLIKCEPYVKKNVTVSDLGHIPMELLSLQFGMK